MSMETWPMPVSGGIQLHVDPQEIAPGALLDCCNVDLNRPFGTARPRQGSRSLAKVTSSPAGGHPSAPLGNDAFDRTARIMRLVLDEAAQRLWAIVRDGVDGSGQAMARAYHADLTDESPGFDTANPSNRFAIDPDRVPSALVHAGRLIIATGVNSANANVVIDPGGLSVTHGPPTPTKPSISAIYTLSGPLTAVTGYTYRAVMRNSRTGQYSEGSATSASTGPLTGRSVFLGVNAGEPRENWDQIEIYRTTDGGSVHRYLGTIPNAQGPVRMYFVDSTLDDALSFKTFPKKTGQLPTSRFVLKHNDRILYIALTGPTVDLNGLVYSDPFAPFNADPIYNYVSVRADDGAEIVAAALLYNRVYVFKSNGSIYELADNRPTTVYRVEPIVSAGPHACLAHASIAEIDGALYYRSSSGVSAFNGESVRSVGLPIEMALQRRRETFTTLPNASAAAASSGQGATLLIASSLQNNTGSAQTITAEIKIYSVAGQNPTVDTPVIAYDPGSFPGNYNIWLTSSIFSINSTNLGIGQFTSLSIVISTGLVPNTTYYVFARPHTAGGVNLLGGSGWTSEITWTTPIPSNLVNALPEVHSAAALDFGLDWWPDHEYWLFCKGAPDSAEVDTCWILDTRTIDSESGPQWRRRVMHATAAELVRGVALESGGGSQALAILGDSLGCIWAWPSGQTDHLVHRATSLTTAQRVGTGELASGTLTDAAQTWPAPGGGDPGLRGQRVVFRGSDRLTYTGLITGNTGTTLTIGLWLEARTPPDGAGAYAIGGIDAHVDTHLSAFEDPMNHKSVVYAALHGVGTDYPVELELRGGDEAAGVLDTAALRRLRRQQISVNLGLGRQQHKIEVRGRFLGLAIGTIEPDRPWHLAQAVLYGLYGSER